MSYLLVVQPRESVPIRNIVVRVTPEAQRLHDLREKRRTQGVASLNYADNLWLIQAERPLKPPGHPEARMACEDWWT